MRYVSARYATVALSALFVAGAGAFVWLVSPRAGSPEAGSTPVEHPGAAPFEEFCAGCHTAESLRPGLTGADDARLRELEAFLQRHGRAPDSADRLILQYLRAPDPGT